MTLHTAGKRPTDKIYKVRGTLVMLNLPNHTLVIQPSVHDGKRLRYLTVAPDSEILAGDERKTLADLIVGDWVRAHFVIVGDRAVLKKLHIPHCTMPNLPTRLEEGVSPTVTNCGAPTKPS